MGFYMENRQPAGFVTKTVLLKAPGIFLTFINNASNVGMEKLFSPWKENLLMRQIRLFFLEQSKQ